MKKHTLADPSREWAGFRPIAHLLDFQKVLSLPLTQGITLADATIPTTVREICDRFAKDIEVDSAVYTDITAGDEKLVIAGPLFNQQILVAVLSLQAERVSPFLSWWFWYDSDWVRVDVQDSYSFFVVYENRIVRESVTLHDAPGNGFDPSVFEAVPDCGWGRKGWGDAETRFWYRKFYQETRIGQLMVLRSDKPELYHYGDSRFSHRSHELGSVLNLLKKIQVLLWALVVVGILVLIRLLR